MDQIDSSNQIENQPNFADDDEFGPLVPNEDKLPKLHVIITRSQNLVQHPKVLDHLNIDLSKLKLQLDEELENINDLEEASILKDFRQELFKTWQKLKAVFKLILKGDEVASEFLLLNLISKVHNRTPEGFILGHLNINLYGLSNAEA